MLVEALARHGTVAVAKVTLRTRERLAVLRPRHGMLVLHTLRCSLGTVSRIMFGARSRGLRG
ncbi:Ku protein [Streptomyces sp. NPDC051664]|uniref:Ku protein n=1 Tax=Streptomyces sp. NPDC051664 TaxID=3365668 RepID=UPI0037B869A2